MPLSHMADDYLSSIKSLELKISSVKKSYEEETNLEMKRKLVEKIITLDTMLNQTIVAYQYINNYYDKDSNIRQWI